VGDTKRKRVKSIQQVVAKKICCGCGACYVICPQRCIEFVYGNRYNYPKVDLEQCTGCGKCLKVCPSAFLLKGIDPGFVPDGPESEIPCYLIYSPDDGIRLDSSSGGFITALILYLMEKNLADGAIVARAQGENPLVAESFLATDREAMLSARASKYAPVSSCVVLRQVLERPGRYVFVGTPCMIQALRNLQQLCEPLRQRIILAIGLVCAGMASRLSTKAYLIRYGVDPSQVWRITYRGGGWPGRFRAYAKDGTMLLDRPLLGDELSYLVPCDHYLRCWNCLDHWGKFADLVVSDPWSDQMVQYERKGKSAVMVRTPAGEQAVQAAVESGALVAETISTAEMFGYNRHLLIRPDHARYAWMAIYQLLFFGRLVKPASIVRCILRRQGFGLRTTVKARLASNYYEDNDYSRCLKKGIVKSCAAK